MDWIKGATGGIKQTPQPTRLCQEPDDSLGTSISSPDNAMLENSLPHSVPHPGATGARATKMI
jgi:hypothetical protein